MRLAAARLRPYALPLRAPWRTAAGTLSVREGWLLRLETEDGRHGYGDCAPLPAAGTETAARAAAALAGHLRRLAGKPVDAALRELLPDACPAARCAVECALLDLAAQAADTPLADFLRGAPCARRIAVNAALGDLIRVGEPAVHAACAEGYRVIKVKVGCAPVDAEIARLAELAALLPQGIRLRLDANRAWSAQDAARFVAAAQDLPIDLLEEPLADPQPAALAPALAQLQADCRFPLALDESGPRDVDDAFFAAPPVRRLVLKPPRLGGLRPALAIARRAAETGVSGVDCVVTSTLESACGVLAAAHLAAALGNDLAHGLATSAWLTENTGLPPALDGAWIELPAGAGLGFVAHEG